MKRRQHLNVRKPAFLGAVILGIALSGVFASVLLSCRQPAGSEAAAVVYEETASIPGILGIRLSFGSAGAGARTVKPIIDPEQFEKITVRLYQEGALVGEKTVDGTEDGVIHARFELRTAGNYNMEVEGWRYADAVYPLFRGLGEKDITNEDITNGINIVIELGLSDEAEASGDTGAILLNAAWPDESAALNAKLYRTDMTTVIAQQTETTITLPATAEISFSDVPAGNYLLALELKRGEITAGYFLEPVTVYPGLVSNRWYGADGAEHDTLTITSGEMRDSTVELQSLKFFAGSQLEEIQLITMGGGGYWATDTIPPGCSPLIKITSRPGQAIGPLMIIGSTADEHSIEPDSVAAVDTATPHIWNYVVPVSDWTELSWTIYASDGSANKTYTIYSYVPVAKLETSGVTSYHTTVCSAMGGIAAAGTGTVTLLKNVITGTEFCPMYGITIGDNRTVTLTVPDGGSATIQNWMNRTDPLFTTHNSTLILLGGGTANSLVLGGDMVPQTGDTLILVDGGGTLTMNAGVSLRNNWNTGDAAGPGAVLVQDNAVFTMNGGTIENNRGVHGGAVYASAGGKFIMAGGEITGNTADNYGGVVKVQGATSRFEMTDGLIQSTSYSDTGIISVEEGAHFDFRGGIIDAPASDMSANSGNLAIHLDSNAQFGQLSLYGSATVASGSFIYLDNNSSAWASVTVPSPFLGSAALKFSGDPSIGTTFLRGAGLTEASLAQFPISSPSDRWLDYKAENGPNPPELRLARTFYISGSGNDNNAGTEGAPYRTPKKALDQVMPQAAAELVFMGTVTGIGDTMTATRNVGAGNNVEVWMNIDGGRKIILSGVANGGVFNGGPSGGGPSYPALWINGGAHVTLKNGIQITGNSSTDNESNIADGLSLVTVFNGTLAFEDSADVTTEQQNDAEPLTARKTIGVRIADGSQAAFIELNSTIGPGRPMHVRPVEDWGHTLATTWVSERQILTGPAVASEYMNFRRSNGAAFTADGRFQ